MIMCNVKEFTLSHKHTELSITLQFPFSSTQHFVFFYVNFPVHSSLSLLSLHCFHAKYSILPYQLDVSVVFTSFLLPSGSRKNHLLQV